MFKKMSKLATGMAGYGMTSGITAAMVTKAGGDATPIKDVASFAPLVGTMSMGKIALSGMKKFKKY